MSMPLFGPRDDPGASFAELLRRLGISSLPELPEGAAGLSVPHATTCVALTYADGVVMKVRYTSLQADVGAAEEDAPSMDWPDLDGRPVVACGLHSQVGIVAAVVKDLEPGVRVAYVMTDGAALPLALSDLVADLTDRGIMFRPIPFCTAST